MGAVRVLRFDRHGERRSMALSGATLLQTEYPGHIQPAQWSYPRLAGELRRIGAPTEDRIELFGRMVFNAVCGNDDDHPRNHAVVFHPQEDRWRLSPAFDVVPNPDPDALPRLTMQLSLGRPDVSLEAVLADYARFGFKSGSEANMHLQGLLQRIETVFASASPVLTDTLRHMMAVRIQRNVRLLRTK